MKKLKFILITALSASPLLALPIVTTSCNKEQNSTASTVKDNYDQNEPEFVTPETDMDKPESQEVKHDDEKPTEPYGRVEETTITFDSKPDQTAVEWMGSRYVRGYVGRQFRTITCPGAIRKGYHVEYWLEETSTGVYRQINPSDPIKKDMKVYPFFQSDVQLKNCLALSALSDSTVSIVNHGDGQKPNLSYSYNGINWTDYYEGTEEAGRTSLDVKSGQVVYFRGRNYDGFSSSESNFTSFSVGGSINLYGNVMTLLDDGQGTTTVIPNKNCFYKLFEGCAGISSISSNFLPATDLTDYCYAYMFNNCVGITAFPSSLLPATTLSHVETEKRGSGAMCYTCMFAGCTGITFIPTNLLVATDLSTYCYYGMFSGCSGLTELGDGVLPATTLKYGCYYGMFALCKNLTTVDPNFLYPKVGQDRVVPRLASRCYGSLFASCTSLTDMGDLALPADNLAVEPVDQPGKQCVKCYEEMFYGCEGMTEAPALEATVLGEQCYYSMFYNCFDLAVAPDLDATVAVTECYMNMFHNCDDLTTIPTIAATTLAPRCCKGMFANCDTLGDLHEKSLPADVLAEGCYEDMFRASKVVQSPQIGTTPANATTAAGCCRHMFYNCYFLIASPALPARTLTDQCYFEMFRNDSAIKSIGQMGRIISTGGTSFASTAFECCSLMFAECSGVRVGSSGTLIANFNAWSRATSSGGNDAFDHMFQGTLGHLDENNEPALSGGSLYWSAT